MNRLSMRTWVRVATVSFALALATAGAHAQFAPVAQERYVFESIGEDFFIISAPDFNPFTASLTTVTHSSTILPDHIFGEGTAGPDPMFGVNSATSFFRLEFDVAQATPFSFTGSLATGLFGSGFAQLSGPGGTDIAFTADEFQSASWSEGGVLQPGRHILEAYASNSIGGDLSTFQFVLAVPSPGALACLMVLAAAPGRRRRV